MFQSNFLTSRGSLVLNGWSFWDEAQDLRSVIRSILKALFPQGSSYSETKSRGPVMNVK